MHSRNVCPVHACWRVNEFAGRSLVISCHFPCMGRRVFSYVWACHVLHACWRVMLILATRKPHLKLFPAVVRNDMAAACKCCVVIAVAVSAIFLSSQQANAQ